MFTIAHLHLLLNHLPIIIVGLGLVLLILATWRGDDHLARVAFAFFATAAASALPVYLTGEGAEEAVDKLPGVSEALIEQHQEIALIAALVAGALGVFSLWSLWRYRRPAGLPPAIMRVAIAGALAATALMTYTGFIGGQIRHTEIRAGAGAPDAGLDPEAAASSER